MKPLVWYMSKRCRRGYLFYTEKEGIDGFYDERIGEKVVSGSLKEIKCKLLTLIEEYDSYIILQKNNREPQLEKHSINVSALIL